MIVLFEAERAAYCNLLAAREEERQCQQLDTAIFNSWLESSKALSAARKREEAAFDAWYAASKALDGANKKNPQQMVQPLSNTTTISRLHDRT